MTKLTFAPHVKRHVDEIMSPLKNPAEWAALNVPFAPYPAAVVRMEGAPGTGKTALANHMARKLTKTPMHISFAGVASSNFGDTERNIQEMFKVADTEEQKVIIMEECDAILWSREHISKDSMHMLSIVNTMLTGIDGFVTRQIPSLLILTTNYPMLLDSALERRITDVIKLEPPSGREAMQMWASKLPMGFLMTDAQAMELASLRASPDQIEKAILRVCRRAMHENRTPVFADFLL